MRDAFDGSQVPMVPGSLRGLRSFDIAEGGELDSLYKRYWWKDGENVGTCTIFQGSLSHRNPKHRAGQANCTCGFYAYYLTSEMRHISPTAVLGVVEGYGRTTLGSLGFRAEKAQIVALYNPHLKKTQYPEISTNLETKMVKMAKALLKVADNRHVLLGQLIVLAVVLAVIWVDIFGPSLGVAADIAPWVSLTVCVWGVITVPLRIYGNRHWGRSISLPASSLMFQTHPNSSLARSVTGRGVPEDRYNRMAQRYRVPIYGSINEMLAEHPLTEYNDVKHLGEQE